MCLDVLAKGRVENLPVPGWSVLDKQQTLLNRLWVLLLHIFSADKPHFWERDSIQLKMTLSGGLQQSTVNMEAAIAHKHGETSSLLQARVQMSMN